jgi:cytidine deaminase
MHLSKEDQALIEEARYIIQEHQKERWHQVGSAVRTRSGRIFSAVNLDANVGRIAVCAEAVATGMGAAAGDTDIDTIVAVNRFGEVVSPCGMCRELISDYSPGARVIVPGKEGEELVSIDSLLPNKYVTRHEA